MEKNILAFLPDSFCEMIQGRIVINDSKTAIHHTVKGSIGTTLNSEDLPSIDASINRATRFSF
jgi:hypothetical protein